VASAWIEHDPPSLARLVVGWLAAALGLALLVGLAWGLARAWRDDLPDPLAIHWAAWGTADGTASLDGSVSATTWLGVAGVALMLGVGAALLTRPRLLRGSMTGLAALAALAPTSLLLTLLPNRGAASWQQATLAGWQLALVVVVPAVLAALAWFASARPARVSTVAPVIPPGAPLAVDRGEYTERQILRGLPWLGAALVALFSGFALVAGASLLILGLLLASIVLWASVYQYRVTDDGVTIGFGPVGLVRRQVPVSEIEGARVVDLRPSRWGGWGYRTTGNDWAVVLRNGPGCRIDLAGKRSLSLTSDEAEALAGHVNAAVARHWGGP
jgi:hypothetical protein